MSTPDGLPRFSRKLVTNLTPGGQGGKSFKSRSRECRVEKLEVWTAGDGDRIKAIRITWDADPKKDAIVGTPSEGEPAVIQLVYDETFTELFIWADTKVYKIQAVTSKGQQLEVGNETGTRFTMATGCGYLSGIQGSADSNTIYRLGADFFLRPYKFRVTNNPVFGLTPGGSAFNATHNNTRVSSIHVWWGGSSAVDYGQNVRGIKLTWKGGHQQTVGNGGPASTKDAIYDFNLQANEVITSMAFSQGPNVGGQACLSHMEFTTSTGGSFSIGEKINNYHQVPDVGLGILLGFNGSAGYAIDRLSAVFAKEDLGDDGGGDETDDE